MTSDDEDELRQTFEKWPILPQEKQVIPDAGHSSRGWGRRPQKWHDSAPRPGARAPGGASRGTRLVKTRVSPRDWWRGEKETLEGEEETFAGEEETAGGRPPF